MFLTNLNIEIVAYILLLLERLSMTLRQTANFAVRFQLPVQ